MSRKTSISSMIMPVAFPLVVLVMLVLLVIFVAVLQFKSGRDYPVKINVSFLMRAAGEMDANTGCLPTSIKSLNDRFYQMKPESNTCNKKIPASFTEVYEAPTNVSPDFKRFVLNRSAPILVTIGRNPLDKNSFGVIISNLNKAGVKTFDKTYRNSDPVPFNGDSLFLGFKTYNYG